MAVVDPDPDWGKRPSARDDQIQVPIAVHVAGENTQSAFLGGNAERTRADTCGELKLDSIPEAFRIPTLYLYDGEVGTAIPVQISNNPALLPQEGCGLQGQGCWR
jgi:hypothetical protein